MRTHYLSVPCTACAVLAALGCQHDSPLDPKYGRDASIAWAVPASAAGRASLDATHVFFSGTKNELVAVDRSTGRIAWRTHTQNTTTPGQTIGFGTAVSGPVVAMTDIDVYAFDRNTGVPRWRFRGETGASPANSMIPASNDSLVFTGSGGGIVWALRATTGEIVWRTPAPLAYHVLALNPVVDGDQLFIGYAEPDAGQRGGIAALDARTGAVLWVDDFAPLVEPEFDAGTYGNVVLDATTVYTWIGRGDVLALDRATGQIKWRGVEAHPNVTTNYRPAGIVNGLLVVGSTLGTLEGLDAATGDTLWTRDLGSGSMNDPIAYDQLVYVTASGRLAAIDPTTGATVWNDGLGVRSIHEPARELFGPGAVDDKYLYMGGAGYSYAFRK